MKKIDIHAHTTNRVLKGMMKPYATLSVLEKEMDKYEVEKTVLLATYFPHRGSGITNYRLLDWIHGNERFAMFASLDFEHYFYQGYNEINDLAFAGKIKGIKIYTCYQNIDLEGENFVKVLETARQFKLPLLFHTGYSYSARRSLGRDSVSDMVGASELENVAKENPDLDFIFAHMSKPFFDDMERVAKQNLNVYADMSGLIDSKHDRSEIPETFGRIKRFLEKAGPRKLLFGTDFPVQTHEDSVSFIEEAMKNFTRQDKEDVYYNNARRLLKWN